MSPPRAVRTLLLFVAEKQALMRFSAQSTNIATIYYPSLIAFHVCLPPLEEQREIVRRVSEHMARVEMLRSSVDAAGDMLAILDRAVLDKAFRRELSTVSPIARPPTIAKLDERRQGGGPGRRRPERLHGGVAGSAGWRN